MFKYNANLANNYDICNYKSMYNPYTNSFYHVLMCEHSNIRLLLESFFYIGTSVSLQALRFQYSH